MMINTQPPEALFGDMDLPNTRLHYVKSGTGPPLIIVPATVSLIRQWLPLTQFMGQRFTSYFFELPGHGGSTPYPEKFKSQFVPQTVEAFVNKLGYDKSHLMGFSFGGLAGITNIGTFAGQDRKSDPALALCQPTCAEMVNPKAVGFQGVDQGAEKSNASAGYPLRD